MYIETEVKENCNVMLHWASWLVAHAWVRIRSCLFVCKIPTVGVDPLKFIEGGGGGGI